MLSSQTISGLTKCIPVFWLRAKFACAWHTIRLHRNVFNGVHKIFQSLLLTLSLSLSQPLGVCECVFLSRFWINILFDIMDDRNRPCLRRLVSIRFLFLSISFVFERFCTYFYTILWPRFAQTNNAFFNNELENRFHKWGSLQLHSTATKMSKMSEFQASNLHNQANTRVECDCDR